MSYSIGHIVWKFIIYLLIAYYLVIMFNQVCKDRDQAECWYLGLTALISAPCTPLLLVNSTNSRRINSCTNSPPSYIQQRSRLFAVHDGRNFTKVHSGIHACMIFVQEIDMCEFDIASEVSYITLSSMFELEQNNIDGDCDIRSR
jgi:hypothetical protein